MEYLEFFRQSLIRKKLWTKVNFSFLKISVSHNFDEIFLSVWAGLSVFDQNSSSSLVVLIGGLRVKPFW